MHEIVDASREERRRAAFPSTTRIVAACYAKFSAIRADRLLGQPLERAGSVCMLSSTRSTFRELSRIVPKVLMVNGGEDGYLPSEIQGLKGWRRRWIHSAITYI